MKYLLLFLCLTAFSSVAVIDNNCKDLHSGTAIAMTDTMSATLNIDKNTIAKEETKTELIFNEPVSDILSEQYALEVLKNAQSEKIPKVKEIFSQYNARNLIIKFTFKDINNKEDIFLVSAIANDYECDVKFNGFITVKREF
ncbi:hypothetical protein QZH36_09655 [Erwinia sp. BC051422]|uniref:hypothetical protein n=1 Tax=Erwinia wuhanensis TaxID=3045167 RepID=UPI002655CCC5|nr:hypothetical protein [Erwinia sp. BC051422]MDN8541706.1 hypothetical protein [Erwinia sp. BC051422]